MTYHVPADTTSGLVGALLIALSLPGIFVPAEVRGVILQLPRNFAAGLVLMVLCTAWAVWLLTSILDLGEFTPQRPVMVAFVIALSVATVVFLPDYLFSRAWGIFLLLVTEVLLSAAFPSDSIGRYGLVLLGYTLATSGIVFTAAPFTLRNLLERWNSNDRSTRITSVFNMLVGVLLVLLGIFAL